MNAEELKINLKSIIESKLSTLINNDYVYWDLPYHINIGDTLIWQGTLDFLDSIPYNMLDFGNHETAALGALSEETVILLHGGGNFGDIYDSSQNFRKSVVEQYPNNRIIILPQTIHFHDEIKQDADFNIFSSHSDLFLCVRDQNSYKLATKYLNEDHVLLLPDMAFCIRDSNFSQNTTTSKKLLMSRVDVEAIQINEKYFKLVDVCSDWPTFEKRPLSCFFLAALLKVNRNFNKNNRKNKSVLAKLIDIYAANYVRLSLIRTGVSFINDFDEIYTTRLHGCILAALLGKKIILLDNSYGKNKAFYEAWLTDYDLIKL